MPLLPKELAILELLVDMKGKLASHKMLLGAVWANKANVTWVGERLRLGSEPSKGINDHWFKFGRCSYEPGQKPAPYDHFVDVAQEVASLVDTQAEAWWYAC